MNYSLHGFYVDELFDGEDVGKCKSDINLRCQRISHCTNGFKAFASVFTINTMSGGNLRFSYSQSCPLFWNFSFVDHKKTSQPESIRERNSR